MKIDQLLVQHFYQLKEVTLQGIGTFRLSPEVSIPQESDKEVFMPENAISFIFDPKTKEDIALIDFIVQQTRKIKPLASADLDSYVVLGKQFLNIGKPFKIEGIGILEKNQQGEYVFSQGNFSNIKKEAAQTALKEKEDDEDISFAANRNRPSPINKYLVITVVVLALALVSWIAWYFLHKNKGSETFSKETIVNQATPLVEKPVDIIKSNTAKTDSLNIHPVRNNAVQEYVFRVVFKETVIKQVAISRMENLTARGHHVIMFTTDSVNYKLAEPFKLPLSDTTRVKDSLNKYFYLGKAYIELY